MPLYLAASATTTSAARCAGGAFRRTPICAAMTASCSTRSRTSIVRLVVLDTAGAWRAPAASCARGGWRWLDRALAADDRPTVVAQHHPPLAAGLTVHGRAMTSRRSGRRGGGDRRAPARRADHQRPLPPHRSSARFAGTMASICLSTAHQPGARSRAGRRAALHLRATRVSSCTCGTGIASWSRHTAVVERLPGVDHARLSRTSNPARADTVRTAAALDRSRRAAARRTRLRHALLVIVPARMHWPRHGVRAAQRAAHPDRSSAGASNVRPT
ncbi:MAG: hypothetical protein M0C28_11490 [Candidatus Moduliflexus flocculans]|nr:hypothetical protein [Candidatus Moduliflexus flocculans]